MMKKLFAISIFLILGISWAWTAAAQSDFSFQKKLIPTNQTEDVSRLQQILITEGLFCQGCQVTGYFGYWTQAGLMNLQERYGLKITGIVNEETRAKLNQLIGFVESKEEPQAESPAQAQTGQAASSPGILALDEAQITEIKVKIAELVVQISELTLKLTVLEGESPFPLQAPQVLFSAPLFLGMRNEDVRKLQEVLAKDPSVYPEALVTGYFGLLTHAAVVRFQEKYADEILEPIGFLTGTGFVGERTLAKLHELFGADISVQPQEGESTPLADSSADVSSEGLPEEEAEEGAAESTEDTSVSSTGGGGGGNGDGGDSPAPAPAPSPTPSPSPTPTPPPVECATLLVAGVHTYSISTVNSPRITQIALALELPIGVPQVVTVKVQDASPITSVSVTIRTDNESNTFSLSLDSGTAENGTWKGQRTVTDTHCTTYSAVITATTDLFTSTVDLSFR